MHFPDLLPLFSRLPAYRRVLSQRPAEPQSVLPAARAPLVAALHQERNAPLLWLTARSEIAVQLMAQLEAWLPPEGIGGPPIYHFVEADALPFERIPWSGATRQRRMTALAALQSRSERAPIVVASARALMQMTLPSRELRLALRRIEVGGIVRLEQMANNWVQTGYQPTDVVEEPGTFARRGGIVDIWPANLAHPVRLDLFGDEVESLRVFDPATQRTLDTIDAVEIGPGGEALTKYGPAVLKRLGLTEGSLNALAAPSRHMESSSPLQDPNLLLAVREELRLEVERLYHEQSFHGIEWYLPYFYDRPGNLLEYLAEDGLVVVDDGAELVATLHELEAQVENLREELERGGELPAGFAPNVFRSEEILEWITDRHPLLLGYGDLSGSSVEANTELARCFAPGPRYGGKIKSIIDDISRHRQEGERTVLVTRQAARMLESLTEADMTTHVQSELADTPAQGAVTLLQGVFSDGFIMRGIEEQGTGSATSRLHFLTDSELFGWSKPRARRKSTSQSSVAPEIFFADLKSGDHVVHIEHGIGQYDGLVKMTLNRVEREYLQVTYAKGDRLYVPVHQADRLSRYVGAGDNSPPVTRLGTADWQAVKARAKREVADIAEDLLKLYAEREVITGHTYSPDGPWQEELEASFPFQETDDQLTAIEAVKGDMESERPMDRLICGDVGYGKTEIAVRAAFKAITDGCQVAVLVPTTVLAQQHYRTFSERLRSFPVRVEMLSRFRTPAQQRKIATGLQDGTVDLVVGTHALLNQQLEFKNLSLLIIDEEQRFGVTQKEQLKQLRTHVDVLTLSATPIPRTLHMSLSGVRDMSTIHTPPKERQPVHTVLAEHDETLIRQAIQRELTHDGQVFVVHNRVRGIRMLANRIQRLLPEATVAIGHGQMAERELENTMMLFADGEIDVLVCTTIIENGLDIPNANTIIINRANHFGLAQLYQLRGRVGAARDVATVTSFYDKGTSLSFDARRRLSAILESSEELGAGFRIAMRDLEIRGAGDLLGAKQHGHIDSIGFDLYTRLLAQAINDAKRKKEVFERELNRQKESSNDTPDKRADDETIGDAAMTPHGAPTSGTSYLSTDTAFDINDPLAPPVTLDLPLDAKIPEYYIEDEGLRLQMYRRIAGLTSVEGIDEMRRELIDRFGLHEETKAVPEEIDNLLFQIRIKILAQHAGVQNIGRELEQLVIRAEALENMNRRAMQRRLRMGLGHLEDDTFVPEEAARVARRAIYLPIDEQGRWRTALARTLEIMAFG